MRVLRKKPLFTEQEPSLHEYDHSAAPVLELVPPLVLKLELVPGAGWLKIVDAAICKLIF